MNGQVLATEDNPRASLAEFIDHQDPKYWAAKLFGMPNPLAPVDVLRKRLVTARNYLDESSKLGNLSVLQTTGEIDFLVNSRGSLSGKTFLVLGPGLWERDIWNYHYASSKGMRIVAIDFAKKSVEFGRKILRTLPAPPGMQHKAVAIDAEKVLTAGKSAYSIDPAETLLINAAEFWQILPEAKMVSMMYELGRTYRQHLANFRMVVVHPFRKDNNSPRLWEGHEFLEVEWGDTTPYSLLELKAPLEAGLCCEVDVSPSSMRWEHYYHQTYTGLTMTALRS